MTNYKSSNFDLEIKYGRKEIFLAQSLHGNNISTKYYPNTLDILNQMIPSIFDNICFNPNSNSFADEVKDTEIGHLLEHLIIENLRISYQKQNSLHTFSGETNWNWEEEPFGKFNIYIKKTNVNRDRLTLALLDSIKILEIILSSKTVRSSFFTQSGAFNPQ